MDMDGWFDLCRLTSVFFLLMIYLPFPIESLLFCFITAEGGRLDLLNTLLNEQVYSPDLRPVKDQDTTIDVRMRMSIEQLQSLVSGCKTHTHTNVCVIGRD